MFQSQITFNNTTYEIVFVDEIPTSIVHGKMIRVFKGSSVAERLRNYVTALLMVADDRPKTSVPFKVSSDTACKVVEALIAPAESQIVLPIRDYRGTGYTSLGDNVHLIKRDGA